MFNSNFTTVVFDRTSAAFYTLYSSPSDTRRDLMMAQCKGRNMLPQQ